MNGIDPTGRDCVNRSEGYFCDPAGSAIGEYRVPDAVLEKTGPLPDMGARYPSHHLYVAESSIADASPKLLNAAVEAVRNDPTPGDDLPATSTGVKNDAGLPWPLADQVISFTATDSNNNAVVANITLPYEHALNPGIVSQGIRIENGRTIITAVGEGHALMSMIMNPLAQATFQSKLDSNLRAAFWKSSQ